MATFAAVLLLVLGASFAQHDHAAWDPNHGDHNLDLGEDATLHTVDDMIRILVDSEHNYVAIKSLHSYTCYMVSLSESHMTAQEILDHINVHGEAILSTEFRPVNQVSHADVQHMFGHRVAHYCLHNPTFILQRYLVPPTVPQP